MPYFYYHLNLIGVWPHHIENIIFDCDGTILDMLPIYFQTNDQILGFK